MKIKTPNNFNQLFQNYAEEDDYFNSGFWINEPKDNTVAIYLYSDIGYWGARAEELVKSITSLDVNEIYLHINSRGGSVYDGASIYNALHDHKAKVITHIDGMCASIASVIALAGDEINMASNGLIMIHDASMAVSGNSRDMKKAAEMLDIVTDSISNIYVSKTGMEKEEILKMMSYETYMGVDEAIEKGFATHKKEEMRVAEKKVEARAGAPEFARNLLNSQVKLAPEQEEKTHYDPDFVKAILAQYA